MLYTPTTSNACQTQIQSFELRHIYNEQQYISNMVLFQAEHNECLKYARQFLSDNELKIYNGYKIGARKYQYLLGRIAAKMALFSRMKNCVKNFTIQSGVFGQPILSLSRQENIQVSISHKKKRAAAIIYPEGHPMAIDIENYDLTLEQVIKTQSTEDELALLSGLPEAYRYNLIWSIKEAVSKIIKTGLTVPFKHFEVTSFDKEDGYFDFICKMKNFSQFSILSKVEQDFLFSLALPKISDTEIFDRVNFESFENFIKY